jgi:hypothetical protein
MKIRDIAISAVDSESTGRFLTRVAQEVLKLEEVGAVIQDIVLNFQNKVDPTEQIQVVIFFTADPTVHGYDMDYVEFQSDPHDTPVAAYEQNLEQVKTWLAGNKDMGIYDVSTQAVIDENGKDVVLTNIYYGTKPQ